MRPIEATAGLRATGLTTWAALVAVAVLGTTSADAADYSFRLGHPLQPSDATHTAMLSFADEVRERTDGQVEIEVFPADQLGRQKAVGEMLVQGGNIMQFTDYLFLAEWVPDAGILQAPFLLDELDDWYKLNDSEWMADLNRRLEEHGILVLSSNNYFGSRSLIGDKPVHSPADLEGVTIREAAAPMYVEMATAWGARPVTMGFAEVYTALSQDVVDFLECPPQTMVSSKFPELRKHVSLTKHMVNWNPVIVNRDAFKAMPEELQQIVIEEAVAAGDYLTEMKKQSDEEVIGVLESMGVTVTTDIDRDAFREASAPVYEAFPQWTPGLVETVRAILDQ